MAIRKSDDLQQPAADPGDCRRAGRCRRAPKADEKRLKLALEIDPTMREQAPAGWKGDQARGAQVLNALFPLLDRNREATLALFDLVKHQPGTDERHRAGPRRSPPQGEAARSAASRGTCKRNDPARRDRHRRHAQGHQACPSLGASAERAGPAGRPGRHAPGGGPRLRGLQAGLDPGSAGAAARAGAGDTPPVRPARESLRLGQALPAIRDRARAEAVRDFSRRQITPGVTSRCRTAKRSSPADRRP